MKKTLLAIGIVTTTCGLQAQERTHVHSFAPKFFYRYHDEINYHYDTWGIGFQYHLKRPEGINLRLSALTNPHEDEVLVESESSLFYSFPVDDDHVLYPLFSTRLSSHNVQTKDSKEYFINKQTLYAGIGWEYRPTEYFYARVEVQGFRDMHNAVLVQEKGNFWGKSYSNPFGARAQIGLATYWDTNAFVDLQGYYAQTFEECYKEMGCELSFNWGF